MTKRVRASKNALLPQAKLSTFFWQSRKFDIRVIDAKSNGDNFFAIRHRAFPENSLEGLGGLRN